MIIDNVKSPKKNDIDPDIKSALEDATREMKTSETNKHGVERDLQEAKPVLDSSTTEDSIESVHADSTDVNEIAEAQIIEAENIKMNTNEIRSSEAETSHALALQTATTNAVLGTAMTGLKTAVHSTDAALYQLSEQLSEDRSQREKLMRIQSIKIVNRSDQINKQQSKIELERSTRVAAEELIEEQQKEIDRARAYADKMEKLLLVNQRKYQEQQRDLRKSREMARIAADLAKKAAVGRQQALNVAKAEKKLREKVEMRAAKAVTIAKNAITALAEAENLNTDSKTKS